MIRAICLLVFVLAAAAATGCGDDGDGGDDATPTRDATASAATPSRSPTVAARPTPDVERVVDRAPGAPWTEADAAALLDAVLLKPADFGNGWAVMNDTTSTNADSAVGDPDGAASNERCQRLLGRTIVSQVEEIATAFIGGETLAYFSMGTVFGTDEGAADCAEEQGVELAAPGALARAFGDLWIDPESVLVGAADYPPVGDSSFSATLTGQIDAAGTIVDLTLLIVAFRSGNVTAVVGSARSGSTPPTEELGEYVDLVLARIAANQ